MKSNASARSAGARYEDIALDHLERAGLALIERNYTCRYGEIDLVMRERDTVVFVEVRYRRGGVFGDGIDSVDAGKRAKLVRAAEVFLINHPRHAGATCRFDVIAMTGDAAAPALDWRRNAFET
jgi:putative endonuclease